MKAVFLRHWVFFLILIVAVSIRFYHLNSDMIFIGDQGRDLLEARRMLTDHYIPLLGIPSSLPRFRQGPLYIWISAITLWIGNGSIFAVSVMSTLFGISAIIAVYLLLLPIKKRAAQIASLLLALSPMAILHSRMPFVVNPIPLLIVLYLWQLQRFFENKKWGAFGSGLLFALLFNSELATFPLVLLVAFVWWSKGHKIVDCRSWIIGIVLGLLPEIIYDFTHKFSQLGLFIIWVGYRIVSAFIPHIREATVAETSTSILTYYLKIFSERGTLEDMSFWIFITVFSLTLCILLWKRMNEVIRLSFVAFCLLFASFFIHSSPSEAYFPPLITLAPIIIGFALANTVRAIRWATLLVAIVLLGLSLQVILSNHFFLLQRGETDAASRRFGAALSLQQQTVTSMLSLSNGQCINVVSQEQEQTFPSYWDNVRFLLADRGYKPCRTIELEPAIAPWAEDKSFSTNGPYMFKAL
ncbi:MAG TPA: glycosyltransferase family 39 protein [Patescibacteria group bacterium]|nr:glycosyltransferase family 39 protein [Patescibacteria group bacterium]